ncbi:uncharacterized protein MELLADRAFT_79314 [Melampsora larici-populina 98AG31]|uniref:SH3 domain-containing protein n=1 Tax=Melampsora larici-populina (strain 98AG31 / pathotype 3-4-7) TaxID=747676 RepID=F4S5C7_MELLP|nr:uncharacterized protein MELLADRAFT_79314 [Melampsora larici-populina 98AG31]EGG00144.1 hypothetical protein MELLADRAFT_79314 [Melampsora larici-populina 98AG31]
MKVLRRSLHKEKDKSSSPSRQSFSPSQQSFGASILTSQHPPPPPLTKPISSQSIPNSRAPTGPPTMVIRAISNYKAKRIVEISFQKGDFFHVVGQREDSEGDWFEASNPATGARGLVPRFGFEIFGKPPSQSNLHTPRHSEFNQQQQTHQHHRSLNQSISLGAQPLSAGPKSAGSNGQKSQPLYGVVQHDFVAERPDELDAKRGEPIIVIAQSNHEWFVAKPIGRLGGPGLIPVSFVEVQDLTSGKALPPDRVKELIRSAVVPKVEEWKKATAAYKGNSIPLGRFDFVPDSSPSTPHSSNRPFSNDGQSQHMSSRSVSATHSRQQSFGMNPIQVTQSGRSSQQTNYQTHHSREPSNSVAAWQQQQQQHQQHHQSMGHRSNPSEVQYDLEDEPEGSTQEGDGYATVDELRERYGVVVHASVESFHHEQGHFWFHLRAHFSRNSSSDLNSNETTVLVLYRLYEDFYEFHLALVEMFSASEDQLPKIPEMIEDVNELVCARRVEELSVYLEELCRMEEEIRECELVYEFLGPREGDVELEGEVGGAGAGGGVEMSLNRSQEEVEGEVVEYLSKMNKEEGNRLEELMNGLTTRDEENGMREMEGRKVGHKESNGSIQTAFDGTSTHSHPYQHQHQHQHSTSIDSRSGTSTQNKNPTGLGVTLGTHNPNPTHQQGNFLKIKIYQIETDDLIAIRVPTHINYLELFKRVKERSGHQIHSLRFKDESGIGFSTGQTLPIYNSLGHRLVGIDNDSDLERWIDSGNKLVLYVE